jgi:transcriptional repressor NrdR
MNMHYGEQRFPDFLLVIFVKSGKKGCSVMLMVKKRDGRKEPFVPEKIVVSAIKSGAPPDIARAITGDIERLAKEGITTQEIKIKVLAGLKSKNPEWERNWLVYDIAVKKRSS